MIRAICKHALVEFVPLLVLGIALSLFVWRDRMASAPWPWLCFALTCYLAGGLLGASAAGHAWKEEHRQRQRDAEKTEQDVPPLRAFRQVP